MTNPSMPPVLPMTHSQFPGLTIACYEPTMILRYKEVTTPILNGNDLSVSTNLVLQQKWNDRITGAFEWRNIPIEK